MVACMTLLLLGGVGSWSPTSMKMPAAVRPYLAGRPEAFAHRPDLSGVGETADGEVSPTGERACRRAPDRRDPARQRGAVAVGRVAGHGERLARVARGGDGVRRSARRAPR